MVVTTLQTVKAVLIVDSEGKRLLSKYFDEALEKEQKPFEAALFEKTRRSTSDIIMFDGRVVLCKASLDVFLYLVGSPDENELILSAVLQTYYDALSILLRSQVEKRAIMDNLDLVFLALDETVSDGILLESDASIIASRVTKRPDQDAMGRDGPGGFSLGSSGVPLGEQTISQAIQSAKEQIAKSLLK